MLPFTLISDECPGSDYCDHRSHAPVECYRCGSPSAVRSEADGRAFCLECFALSACDSCGEYVPEAETYESGVCCACERRALIVSVAGLLANALRAGPRKTITVEGVTVAA